MQKNEVIDVEKIVEQGKSILKGKAIPTSTEEIKTTLESIEKGVEQVRYAEVEKLSETGKSVLKDLEEILIGGAEVTSAIPPETFLHAARAQQKVSEAVSSPETQAAVEAKSKEVEESVVTNLGSLLRLLMTSNEFRDVISDWSSWLKNVLIFTIAEAQKVIKEEQKQEIGQGPVSETEKVSEIPSITDDQLDKLVVMLEWTQDRQEYQSAISYIFNQFSNLSAILGIEESEAEGEGEGDEGVGDREATKKLKEAMVEAKAAGVDTLKAIENWTHHSTEPFQSTLASVSNHLKSDIRFRSSIQSLIHFLANCFNEPGFLNDRQWIRDEARNRLEEVRVVLTDTYKTDLQNLIRAAENLLKAFDREPRTTHLKESLRKLLEDLFVADPKAGLTGAFRLKTELISDMGVLVGGLLERVRYLRVPDIQIHDDDLDFTARNIILDAAELVPQQFKLTVVTENMVEKVKHEQERQPEVLTEAEKERIFVERELLPSQSQPPPKSQFINPDAPAWQTHLKFAVKGIHGHCRNVHFDIRKRTGFPQLTDEGQAALRVWGVRGMLIKVVLKPEWVTEQTIEREIHTKETIITTPSSSSTSSPPSENVEKVTAATSAQKLKLSIVKAHCVVDELDLDLHGTRRDWFYTVMGPIVRKRVKNALEAEVERTLLSLMD